MSVITQIVDSFKRNTFRLTIAIAIVCLGTAGYYVYAANTSTTSVNKSNLKVTSPAKTSTTPQTTSLPVSSSPDQSSNSSSNSASAGLQGQAVQPQPSSGSTGQSSSSSAVQAPSCSGCPSGDSVSSDVMCPDDVCISPTPPPATPTPTPTPIEPVCAPCGGIHEGDAAGMHACPQYCME